MVSFVAPHTTPSPRFRLSTASVRVVLTDEALPFDPLANIPSEVQSWAWSRLLEAVEETVWDRAACPPVNAPEITLPVSRPGQPPLDSEMLRHLPLRGQRRMLRLEVRLALEALEAWLLSSRGAAALRFLEVMREHCDRIGALYAAMRLRLGGPLALAFLTWELRMLRHRGSYVVAPLAFGEISTFRATQ